MIPKHQKGFAPIAVTQRGVLDPLDRFSEIFFGLLMALTFTGTISVGEAGRADVRTLLIAALGCNLAWGFVDAIMFVIARSAERIRNLELGKRIAGASDRETARRCVMEALPEPMDSLLDEDALDRMIEKIRHLTPPKRKPFILWSDIKGAVAVFLLVVLSTFPVALPFLFTHQVWLAMRISNGVAIIILFILGAATARYSKQNPLLLGLATVGVGIVLILSTIALGG